MAPKVDQATIIVLDVGRNVANADEKNENSFFEQAKECTARIIERKIMSQGKNRLGVILLGSKKTKNNMAELCPGAFRHIEVLAELQEPTWKMIRNLPEKPTNSRADWLDGLVVAADHYKNGVSGVVIGTKKVILITNFKPPSKLEPADFEQVLNGYVDEQFEIDIIGPDIYDEADQNEDYALARVFMEKTKGATAAFSDTMQYLQFHRKRVVKPMPWYIDLCIGPDIKIPVAAYIKLRDEPIVKNWQKTVKDPVTSGPSTTEGIMQSKVHINVENQEVVESKNVTKGYKYGQEIIPFSESDNAMLYKSGEKSLTVYGFTASSNITWQVLNGDGTFYIFGKKDDPKSKNAVRCLVERLQELNLVGIVRRVYTKNSAPRMFALMPVIDSNNFICLSMVGICYKDEIKNMSFPSINLKKYNCTDEQVNAFKDLIKAMDLTKAYDDTFDDSEAFPVAETVSPSVQYVLDCIAYRAMNPGKPLPQPRDEIMTLFKQPPLVEKRSREPLEKLKKLFTLTKVEVKTKSKTKVQDMDIDNVPLKTLDEPNTSTHNGVHDVPKIQLPVKKSNEITKIGTMEPVNDFKALLGKGKSLSDLSSEMTSVIETLLHINIDGTYSKGLIVMKFFREQCVKSDPSHYNDWLQNFRKALNNTNKVEIWNLIIDNKLGYILKLENSSSTYENEDSHEDSQLYENDTIPNSTEISLLPEVDTFDDM